MREAKQRVNPVLRKLNIFIKRVYMHQVSIKDSK